MCWSVVWWQSLDSALCRRRSLVCQNSANSLCPENKFKWRKDFCFFLFACVYLVFFFFFLLFAPTEDNKLLRLRLRCSSYPWQQQPLSRTGYKIGGKQLGTAVHGMLWLRSSYVRALTVPYACQHLPLCAQKNLIFLFFFGSRALDKQIFCWDSHECSC